MTRTKLDAWAFFLSIALSESSGGTPLADLWGSLLPLCGVSSIKAQRGEMRPSSKFSFVRGHRLCHYEGRGGHLKSTPLIHHAHMQCTYHMSNRESTKETTSPLPKTFNVRWKTYKSDFFFMSTLIHRVSTKAELLLWVATKGIQVFTLLSWHCYFGQLGYVNQPIDSATGTSHQGERKIFRVDEL